MKTIEVKIWPVQFDAVVSGQKRHEVRVNDRDYQEGDQVVMHCWNPMTKEFDGRSVSAEIGHVTRGFGLPADIVVFTLLNVKMGGDTLIDTN